jgi:hypothetical protein
VFATASAGRNGATQLLQIAAPCRANEIRHMNHNMRGAIAFFVENKNLTVETLKGRILMNHN